jgi:hypothetical protein
MSTILKNDGILYILNSTLNSFRNAEINLVNRKKMCHDVFVEKQLNLLPMLRNPPKIYFFFF